MLILNLRNSRRTKLKNLSLSIDIKLVHRIFNEVNSQVKYLLDEISNQTEFGKFTMNI